MAEKFLTKTRAQLAGMILSNARIVSCRLCGVPLGKLVAMPCDPENGQAVITLCEECSLWFDRHKLAMALCPSVFFAVCRQWLGLSQSKPRVPRG